MQLPLTWSKQWSKTGSCSGWFYAAICLWMKMLLYQWGSAQAEAWSRTVANPVTAAGNQTDPQMRRWLNVHPESKHKSWASDRQRNIFQHDSSFVCLRVSRPSKCFSCLSPDPILSAEKMKVNFPAGALKAWTASSSLFYELLLHNAITRKRTYLHVCSSFVSTLNLVRVV